MTTPFPFSTEQMVFSNDLFGTYGAFKTDESFELDFVLASMPISRIKELETASQALDVRFARFADLVQRDIDLERVQEIANDYLDKGKDRVVFFPPLLVSLVAFDETPGKAGQTGITELYSSVVDSEKDGWAERTWDKNRFQLRLALAQVDTGATIIHGGKARPIYNYGCQLKWNPNHVKLVVIDGQHRLCALRALYSDSERRHVVANVCVPVCVVFSPRATKNSPEADNILTTLRDLFVTINKTAQNVSGHFLVLLDDKSLSSLTVRDFAQAWKKDETYGFSKLHLLEWNQRNKQKANQRTRAYSITTVTILADALERYVFNEKTGGLTRVFLNLEERRDELESGAPDEPTIDDISERSFSLRQSPIIQEQISRYVAPALLILFGELSPYQRQLEGLKKAVTWLDSEVKKGVTGAASFRDEVFAHYRTATKLDSPASREVEAKFEEKTEPAEKDSLFFLNVFQQGLVHAWVDLAQETLKAELSPVEAARMMAAGLEKLCLNPEKDYFAQSSSYTRLSLYREGGTTMVTESARDQWARLILASFLNEDVAATALQAVEKQTSKESLKHLRENLSALAHSQLEQFESALRKAIEGDLEKYWMDRELTQQHQKRLQELIDESGSESEEFRSYIQKISEPRIKKAIGRLRSILELTPDK